VELEEQEYEEIEDETFYHTLHVALWDWLSKNPEKQKDEWPEWDENGGEIEVVESYCFACSSATNQWVNYFNNDSDALRGTNTCDWCPLVLSEMDAVHPSNCLGGWFHIWLSTKSLSNRIAFAEKIRDFPVREGVKVK
jgi:hypothetical protein